MQAWSASTSTFPFLVDRLDGETTDAEQFLSAAAAQNERLHAKLAKTGALLFRGFPALSIPELARFASEFAGRDLLSYVAGASPRTQLGGGVYTSTEYPPEIDLPLHNELSYTFEWPEYLFFYCEMPAAVGGETPIADSREILKRLDPELVRRFKSSGLRYERVLDDGPENQYSWQAAFETDAGSVVEGYCERGGIDLRWNRDGSLWLSEARPATAIHPKTGDEVWFNQADGFHPSVFGPDLYQEYLADPSKHRLRLNVRYGDGEPIALAGVEHIRSVIRESAVPVEWRAGDILVVDNMLACHGRRPFSGHRKVFLAMA